MICTDLSLEGLKLINPKVFVDSRGYFFESFQQEKFNAAINKSILFVQDNESMSQKNILRGLHFQIPPMAQDKLVRVVTGSVFDVAVDIRKNSLTYGLFHGEILSAENKKMMWIPRGFAHGFLTLENNTIFQYKCTQYYDYSSERSLLWNDPQINIQWNISNPILSEKDKQAIPFSKFESTV